MLRIQSLPFFANPGNLLPRWVSYLLEITLFAPTPEPLETGPLGVDRSKDKELVREALEGNQGFEKLVRAYEKLVYRVAFRFLGNEPDSSDVAQEVFLRIHRALPRFRGESALSTWIYAITANLSRNAIRARKNREKTQVLAPEEKEGSRPYWEQVRDPGASSSKGAENRELSGALQKALETLPPDYREAVILRDMEDLDYGEIAKVLQTSLGTVKSRIARGRALLREKLERYI
jgi:RNA polymerase sigma-70 factor (ECF subfamily)